MPTRRVQLSEHFQHFIETGVSAGRYQDASEVVREGLRLLERREQEDQARLEWLRGAVQDANDSLARGEGRSFGSVHEAVDHIEQMGRSASLGTDEHGQWTSLCWFGFLPKRSQI